MNWHPGWVKKSFHPDDWPATEYEHKGCHMDLEEYLTLASCLISEITHEGCKTDVCASKEKKIVFTLKYDILGEYFRPKG